MHSENLENKEVIRVLLIVYRNNYNEANLNPFRTIINSSKSQVKIFFADKKVCLGMGEVFSGTMRNTTLSFKKKPLIDGCFVFKFKK